MQVTTKAQLISALAAVVGQLNRLPTTKEFSELSGHTYQTAVKKFKSWNNFIKRAGFEGESNKDRTILSNKDLKQSLIDLSKELGRQPTVREFKKLKHSDDLIRARFGSWRKFVESCGFKYLEKTIAPQRSATDLRADVQLVRDKINRFPTVEDYSKYGNYNPKTVIKTFGNQTWQIAIAQIFQLSPEEAKKISQPTYKTTAERLEELRGLAKKLRHTPSSDLARKHGFDSLELARRCGGWAKAVEQAGLPPVSSRKRPGEFLTNEQLFAEAARINRQLGKIPTAAEFDKYSKLNHKTVAKKVGGGKWSGVTKLLKEKYFDSKR